MVVGVESRGFIVAAPLALELGTGFVPIRKPGKLPGETFGVEYTLEYGEDRLEIHKDALGMGTRVLMVDDLLATGGTMEAACRLVERIGCQVVGCSFVVELVDLHGRQRLQQYKLTNLVEFEGE
jgi:adenine phosphoribosyltransferase